jgi:hypothetical protein
MRIRPLLCPWLCLALASSARGEPEDRGPRAVEIEVYCADLQPGDGSTRQAFDLWLDLLRHGKAAPFEPARLVCRKQYAVQDACEFDDRERFEPASEAVLAGAARTPRRPTPCTSSLPKPVWFISRASGLNPICG